MLPSGAVGKAYHEVIVPFINVGRDDDVVSGIEGALTGGYREVLIVDPGLYCSVLMLMLMLMFTLVLMLFLALYR